MRSWISKQEKLSKHPQSNAKIRDVIIWTRTALPFPKGYRSRTVPLPVPSFTPSKPNPLGSTHIDHLHFPFRLRMFDTLHPIREPRCIRGPSLTKGPRLRRRLCSLTHHNPSNLAGAMHEGEDMVFAHFLWGPAENRVKGRQEVGVNGRFGESTGKVKVIWRRRLVLNVFPSADSRLIEDVETSGKVGGADRPPSVHLRHGHIYFFSAHRSSNCSFF